MKSTLAFPNIMTALDLSEMDEKLIAYSRFIAKTTATKSLRYVHVIPHFILPEPVSSTFVELVQGVDPIEQRVMYKLDKAIQPVANNGKGLKTAIVVLEGKPLDTLLKAADEQKPDLLVVGNKSVSSDSGIIARRIARQTNCSVLFVTEMAETDIERILVPVDFSDTSARALHTAIQLAKKLGEVKIEALHVIDMPMTAYKINRNQQEIMTHLKDAANAGYKAFLKRHGLDKEAIQLTITVNDVFDVGYYIQETAFHTNADLIIIGAKGHTLFEDFIFGSTTEKLVNKELDIPILVVR